MSFFHEFSRKAPNRIFATIALGGMAGICYSILIPVIISSLAEEDHFLTRGTDVHKILSVDVLNVGFATLFFCLCALILLARSLSQVVLIGVAAEMTADLRLRLYTKILKAPIAGLDQIGSPRLTAVLTEDVNRVVAGARTIPDLLISTVSLLGMLGFLCYLNTSAFYVVIKAIFFGILTYQIPVYLGTRVLIRSRKAVDDLHESIRGLILGAKELKLDAKRRDAYVRDVLTAGEERLRRSNTVGHSIIAVAANYGDLVSFLLMGFFAFVFMNYWPANFRDLTSIIMALLYISTPVAVILSVVPQITLARISMRNIEQVLMEVPEERTDGDADIVSEWREMRLRQVAYKHREFGSTDGYLVGPVDLRIARGELTFIVGGNGSGKSTLGKIISLHYHPAEGEVFFDNVQVDGENRDHFRQHVGAIFPDFHLFQDLLLDIDEARRDLIEVLLRDLGLDDKVRVDQGRFSTLELSDGQRKRLGLLVMMLQDRSLYIFDEWAADQDPVFKDIFYKKILPDLRSRDKAVVVISHDDRYFEIADNFVVMERGQSSSGPDGRGLTKRGDAAAIGL